MGEGEKIIAVVGDVHGRWEELVAQLEIACSFLGAGERLDAVLQIGDAEATVDEGQLAEVHAKPDRHRLGDFHRVVAGEIVLPAPLYFIGGNHEPWRSLDRNGGIVRGGAPIAENVHFLGRSGVVDVAGMTVAFFSGIRRPSGPVLQTAAERDALSSVREHGFYVQDEVDELMRVESADILLTHDWPSGSGFVHKTELVGDEAVARVLQRLRPLASFHGHLHRREDFVVDGIPVFARGCWGQGVPEWVSLVRVDLGAGSVTPFPHIR